MSGVLSTSNTGPTRASLLDNLFFPTNKEGKTSADVAHAARRQRPAFTSSPYERETNRVSRSGRQLSELEILQDKHDPEFKQIVPSVADAISAVLAQHAILARTTAKDTRFDAYETSSVPGILVEDYVHRIAEYTYISPATMVAALMLLDRLSARFPKLLFSQLNIFKLFFVAVRVASKVVDLRTLNNKNFASVGGVSNRHLNDLEAKFLVDLKFDLFLSPNEFFHYATRLNPPQSTSVPRGVPTKPVSGQAATLIKTM